MKVFCKSISSFGILHLTSSMHRSPVIRSKMTIRSEWHRIPTSLPILGLAHGLTWEGVAAGADVDTISGNRVGLCRSSVGLASEQRSEGSACRISGGFLSEIVEKDGSRQQSKCGATPSVAARCGQARDG